MGAGFNSKNIQSPQRQLALLGLSKTGGSTPVLSGLCASFCKVNDLGVGIYEIEVNVQRPFAQKVHAVATLHAATPGVVTVDPALTDKLKVTVKTFEVDGVTPDDLDFDILIMGCFALDLIGP